MGAVEVTPAKSLGAEAALLEPASRLTGPTLAKNYLLATLWGMAVKEWKGTSRRTKSLVALGLFLLVGSTVAVGYGNYLKVR